MKLNGKVALVTGANGGIGSALVKELLDRGAAKVYAAARSAVAVAGLVSHDPKRVVAIELDITSIPAVTAAAARCWDTELLINNAGVNRCVGLFSPSGMDGAREEMDVNFFGTLAMCRAFAPALVSCGGTLVNVCSIIGLVNLPVNGTYCASKAAGHSLLQGIRAELAPRGVSVVGVYPGPVDTRMTAGLESSKATPEQVAAAILAGVENGDEEIFPDSMSAQVHAGLLHSPKQVEREFATMIPAWQLPPVQNPASHPTGG